MIQLLGDTSYDAKRIVWLRGEAGTGKSVIAGCVAKELKKTNILAGSFFCQHDNKKRDNVAAMIQNLSYQLAHADECFKDALGRSLQDTPLKGRKKRNTKELVDHLILSPMGKWPSNKPCVIVIDALDELTDMDKVSTIFESFQSTPIKLFLTSRHDVPITFDVKTLSHLETFNIKDERTQHERY
ncbi:hypothetical protein BDR26DRAFT_663144 [Obelidium mucronatum]|nr:hypothetical protein BDR26DRAFT_663144 [Obelidium mucronatum]